MKQLPTFLKDKLVINIIYCIFDPFLIHGSLLALYSASLINIS